LSKIVKNIKPVLNRNLVMSLNRERYATVKHEVDLDDDIEIKKVEVIATEKRPEVANKD
jgi:hypothetical protein